MKSNIRELISFHNKGVCKTKIFFLSVIIAQFANAQDVWTPIANCPPSMGRTGEISFSTGSKGYVGFGLEICPLSCIFKNDLWEYDPSNDSWTQKANCPGAPREWAVAFGIANKGY